MYSFLPNYKNRIINWEYRLHQKKKKVLPPKVLLSKIINEKWGYSPNNFERLLSVFNFKKNDFEKTDKILYKDNSDIINKQKLLKLTKKQLRRVKIKKLSKLIWPNSVIFRLNKKVSRSWVISKNLLNYRSVLNYDGYSWQKIVLNTNSIGRKIGFVGFQTRALSFINVSKKGKGLFDMKQKRTYKIKTVKVKRKK